MEGAVEDDHGGPAGGDAGDLDGVLDSLGARVDEQALLLLAAAGRELGQPAADLHVGLVHTDHEALVQIAVGLVVDRSDRRRQSVARVLAPEPAGEVDVGVAVDVLDAGALGARDDERRRRHAHGDIPLPRVQHLFRRAPLLQRHSRSLQLLETPFLVRQGRIRPVMLAAVSASGVAIFLSLVAGVAGSVQVAVSGAFGKRIGVLEATAFGSLGAALIVCSLVLVTRQGFGGVAAGFREPAWLWLNGVMGAIVVLTITFTAPRIGTFATIGLLIAGQLAMGVLIDYLGLFGLERIPLGSPHRRPPPSRGRGAARPQALAGELEQRRESLPAGDLAAVCAVEDGTQAGALDCRDLVAAVDLGAGHVERNRVKRLGMRDERGTRLRRIGVRAAVGVAGERRRPARTVSALRPEGDREVVARLSRRLRLRPIPARAATGGGKEDKGQGGSG